MFPQLGRAEPPILFMRAFDPLSVITIEGTIEKVELISHPSMASEGVHLVVKASNGKNYLVSLGPRWFLEDNGIEPQKGQQIELTGSIVTVQGQNRLIASEVNLNKSRSLELRNEQGVPAWSGFKRAMR